MGLGIGRAFGLAVKGTLKGVYEGGVVPEERKRETYTTAALNANIKKALKLEDERIKASKEAREEIEKVKALEGATNSSGKVLTEVERTAVVRQAKAMDMDVYDLLEEFEVVTSKDAKIIPGKPVIYKLGQVADFEDREDAGFFAAGRNKQISEDVAKLLKASGVETEVQIPTPNTVEGVKLTRKQKDNAYEGFEYGSYTIKQDGELKVVAGILNPELDPSKGRLFLNTETNKYEEVPADAKWNGTTPKTTISKPFSQTLEVYNNYDAGAAKRDPRLSVRAADYREAVSAGNTLMEGLERMSKLALDDRNYSSLMSLFGSVSRGLKNEFAGFNFVFANNDVTENAAYEADSLNIRNADGTLNVDNATTLLNTLGKRYNILEKDLLKKAEDISSNRQLMEIQALRMAIAEIVVDGDTRPSDFDVQSRMRAYRTNGSTSFLKLANETIEKTKTTLNNRRNIVSGSAAIKAAMLDQNDKNLNDLEKEAAKRFINTYAPTLETALKLPSFTQQGFDTDQFVNPPKNLDQPIIELHTKEDGTKVKRVIMPDGGYLRDGGKVLEAPETMPDEAMMKVASELLKKEQK